MATNTYWLKFVLKKLFGLYSKGGNIEGRDWHFSWDKTLSDEENINNCDSEVQALEALTNSGIVDIGIGNNEYRTDHLKRKQKSKRGLDYIDIKPHLGKAYPPALKYPRSVILLEYNHDKFMEQCKFLNFDPTKNIVEATLTLDRDGRTVCVITEGRKYKLDSLNAGRPLLVFSYCRNNPDRDIPISEIRQETRQNNIISITQVFRNSVLKNEGVLRPFISMSPHMIHFSSQVELAQSELNAIKEIAKTSDS